MAALILESLPQTKTGILTAVRAIELVLLSTGLVYSIRMFKGAVFPSSYDFMLSSFRKPVSLFRSWSSSPFYICIFMNIIVILIAVSSLFHNPKGESSSDIEDSGGDTHEDYDLHSALSPSISPPPAPPPMQHQKNHPQERKPKDIAVAAPAAAAPAAAARIATATKKCSGGGKIATATTSLKNQQDTEEERVVECLQQAVFSDFSRLAKAKEIRKAQAPNDGGKIRTAKQGTWDTIAAKATDHDFAQATAKYEQVIRNEEQNQTKKQLENEDGDEDTDTMEATWRAIKGGTKTQEKSLKKSETWPQPQKLVVDREEEENMALLIPSSGGVAQAKELRKSMTFNDTVSITCRGGLRRDPSMNLEEFNQRVEAFIQKFNHEMRLQRQESDQRYLDMISRGI